MDWKWPTENKIQHPDSGSFSGHDTRHAQSSGTSFDMLGQYQMGNIVPGPPPRPILGRQGPDIGMPMENRLMTPGYSGTNHYTQYPVTDGYNAFRQREALNLTASAQQTAKRKNKIFISRIPSGVEVFCAFCYQNQETKDRWSSHKIKDKITGKVTCPILRSHVCQLCGATGDIAHTETYCRKQPIGRSVATALKSTLRNSTGLRNQKRY